MWQKHERLEFLTRAHAITGEGVTARLHGRAQNHPDHIHPHAL